MFIFNFYLSDFAKALHLVPISVTFDSVGIKT